MRVDDTMMKVRVDDTMIKVRVDYTLMKVSGLMIHVVKNEGISINRYLAPAIGRPDMEVFEVGESKKSLTTSV